MSEDRQGQNERVGSIAGLGAGVIAGAGLGSALIPIPVIGTFAGALVGGVVGSEVGRTVGSALLNGINAFTESLTGEPPEGKGPDKPAGS